VVGRERVAAVTADVIGWRSWDRFGRVRTYRAEGLTVVSLWTTFVEVRVSRSVDSCDGRRLALVFTWRR